MVGIDFTTGSALQRVWDSPTMASADFCSRSCRSLRVRRVTFLPHIRRIYAERFRMTSGFESHGPLAHHSSPSMRFVFLGPGVCLQLPSDSGSPQTPLLFG